MSSAPRTRLSEELVRRLAAALRSTQLYAANHPLLIRNVSALVDTLATVHATTPSIAIGIVGAEVVVGGIPVPRAAENMGELMRRLQQSGIERIVIDRGVEPAEVTQLVQAVGRGDSKGRRGARTLASHSRRTAQVEQRIEHAFGDVATFRRLYDDRSVAGSCGTPPRSRGRRTPMPHSRWWTRWRRRWPRTEPR